MKTNVGSTDRVVRVLIGVVLIMAALFSGFALFDGAVWKYGAVAVGGVLIVTAAMRFCGLYTLFGIKTCRT
jgi:hypothetical protein